MSRFPKYPPGTRPKCFNCDQQMPRHAEVTPTGFAPGLGAYQARCEHCSMFTHFDFTEETAPCTATEH